MRGTTAQQTNTSSNTSTCKTNDVSEATTATPSGASNELAPVAKQRLQRQAREDTSLGTQRTCSQAAASPLSHFCNDAPACFEAADASYENSLFEIAAGSQDLGKNLANKSDLKTWEHSMLRMRGPTAQETNMHSVRSVVVDFDRDVVIVSGVVAPTTMEKSRHRA